jgi:uncharacterized protein
MHVFKYFDHPHTSPASTWSEEVATCALCGAEGPGYDGPFYGDGDDVDRVCEECLASGELAVNELSTNEGDVESLRAQLEKAPAEQREALVEERTAEVATRTPGLVTWQDLPWPAHCGDYCRFLGEGGQKELNALAPDGNGEAFFREHLYAADRELGTPPFEDLPPQAPTREEGAYDVGVYLFRCLGCGAHVIRWDAN